MPRNVNDLEPPQAGADSAYLGQPHAFSSRSGSSPNQAYLTVIFDNGKGWCSCPSKSWYDCKHLTARREELKAMLRALQEPVDEPPAQEEVLPF